MYIKLSECACDYLQNIYVLSKHQFIKINNISGRKYFLQQKLQENILNIRFTTHGSENKIFFFYTSYEDKER